MAKTLKRDIWEYTPFEFGLYVHKKNKKVAMASQSTEKKYDWIVDKGQTRPHPIFRLRLGVVQEGTGNFFFNKILKDYVFVGKDTEGYVAGEIYKGELPNDSASSK